MNRRGIHQEVSLQALCVLGIFRNIELAIIREKQLKGGNRKQKLELIESINPEWNDLTEQIKELI